MVALMMRSASLAARAAAIFFRVAWIFSPMMSTLFSFIHGQRPASEPFSPVGIEIVAAAVLFVSVQYTSDAVRAPLQVKVAYRHLVPGRCEVISADGHARDYACQSRPV